MSLFLKPNEGRRVRHADGRLFAVSGARVPMTAHYLRLHRAGDLIAADNPTAKSKTTRSITRRKTAGQGSTDA